MPFQESSLLNLINYGQKETKPIWRGRKVQQFINPLFNLRTLFKNHMKRKILISLILILGKSCRSDRMWNYCCGFARNVCKMRPFEPL